MHTFWKIAIPLLATLAIVAAFGEGSASAESRPGGGQFGEPGFDSTSVQQGQNTRITGASYVKVAGRFYDVQTMREISMAEAAARAVAEGQAMP